MDCVTLVGGAVLGVVFTSLYDVVKESRDYKPMLKRLKRRLRSLEPLIEEVRRTNTMLQGIEDIKEEMEASTKLIQECSRAHWLTGTYTKYRYASKLRSLDRALKDLMQILIAYGVLQMNENNNVLTKICPSPLPEPPRFTVGLVKPLGELKKLIGIDGESMVVITAPGGCGKTTLATMFCHDHEVKDKYKNIFFVTVSENPSWDNIVEQLFLQKGLDYKLLKNERNTDSWLKYFLPADQPSLLVLDEVWLGWESRKLLDKFDLFKNSNCKILVTSRFHFPKFHSYYLKSLNDEDAKELFRHSALLGDRSCAIPESLSEKVLDFCKGLPFAITVVGESLARQEREIWERVTKGSILKSEIVVHNRLESSLNALKSENPLLKECFLDLALFFEDQLIPAAALIDMWSELYDDLTEDSLCIANLTDLKNRTLANLVFPRDEYTYGYYSEHFVTQHEMLRELAIYHTSLVRIRERKRLIMNICGDNFPRWKEELMCQPLEAHLLSITTDRAFSTEWCNIQPPRAEVLVLNCQTKCCALPRPVQTEDYTLPKFGGKIDNLKVLIVTYNGYLPATLSNPLLLGSMSNLKRMRLERISIIIQNGLALKSLCKMSFFMCNISQTFRGSSIQFSDAFPNLVELNIDHCNDLVELPASLCDHIVLKKLGITNCHMLSTLPEEIGNSINLEELRLLACTKLSELPNSITMLTKLKLLDISCCRSITKLPDCIGELGSLRNLIMRHCSNLLTLPTTILDLNHLEDLQWP